jgi:hypothetical protein
VLIFQGRVLRLRGEVSVILDVRESLMGKERVVDGYVFGDLSSPDIRMGEISHNNTSPSPFCFCLKMFSRADGHVINSVADLVRLDEARELAGYILPSLVIGIWESSQWKTIWEKALLGITLEKIIEHSLC